MERLAVFDAQQEAERSNKAAHDMFHDHVAPDWIARNIRNRDNKLVVEPPPAVPLMLVVSDAGVTSQVPFPDLAVPVLPPNVPTGTQGFPLATTGIPADRLDDVKKVLDRQTQMMLVLNGKLDQILAKP